MLLVILTAVKRMRRTSVLQKDRKFRIKVLRFETEKLHGHLSFTLEFHSNLVFLTGINGSGKTAAVRAITRCVFGKAALSRILGLFPGGFAATTSG